MCGSARVRARVRTCRCFFFCFVFSHFISPSCRACVSVRKSCVRALARARARNYAGSLQRAVSLPRAAVFPQQPLNTFRPPLQLSLSASRCTRLSFGGMMDGVITSWLNTLPPPPQPRKCMCVCVCACDGRALLLVLYCPMQENKQNRRKS